MDEKTLNALTILATKLGVTAEYLWGVLLKQAPISGATDLLVCAAWIVGVYAWAKHVRNKTTRPATADDRYVSAEWGDEARVVGWITVGIAVPITALIVGIKLTGIVAALFNPEYWALRQILG